MLRRSFRPRVERLESRDTPSTTVLTVSPNPTTVGQSVTLTAVMTETGTDIVQPGRGTPTSGTVTFFDGSTPLGSAPVVTTTGTTNQGSAQFTTSALGAGPHSLSAQYSGDTVVTQVGSIVTAGSTSNTVSEVINPLPTSTPTSPVNVSSTVSLTPVKPAKHHHTNPLSQHFTLHNTGNTPVQGPFYVVLRGLNPKVHLKNAAGVTTTLGHPGDPYVRLDISQLAAGQSLDVLFSFSNPHNKHISFSTEVFAGSGTP